MTFARRLWSCAVAVVLAMLVGLVAAPGASASTSGSFVSLVNSARASAGLKGYAVSSDLTSVAQGQAQRMASQQKLYHNPGLATQVKSWKYVGENVGYGPDVSTLFSAFMHSAPHRANILDHDFTQVGIGAVTVGGTLWVSMVFRDPMHATTSKPSTGSSTKKTTVKASSTASAGRPARAPVKGVVPPPKSVQDEPGMICSATAADADRVRAVTDLDRSARLVESAQMLVRGFQCGRDLPMTGVLDDATLAAVQAL
jgi:hypothetical protein